MKKRVVFFVVISLACLSAGAQLSFTGASRSVITVSPEASTGLDAVYVVSSAQGVTASYTSSDAVSWSRFSNLGAAYAEAVTDVKHDGNTYSITLGADDMGYVIEDGGRQHYYWVVNYANHEARFDGLAISAEQDCDRTSLELQGKADRIVYYTINGRGEALDRGLTLTYTTLVFDEEAFAYKQTDVTEDLEYVGSVISVPAPLCDTDFELAGDCFMREWGIEEFVSSPTFTTRAVQAETAASQQEREVENEQKIEGGTLGGSAPCEVLFQAAVSDAAVFREWQLSKDPDFGIIENSFSDLEVTYTFNEQGTTYVRFIAADASGECEYYGDTYEVFVGESALQCPNAFSPFTSPGVNDEWRVSYKSIISFECHIFNKWGTKMATLTDPSQGWDGRYGGKEVPAGVYYYVIKAEGADGKQYKLSGDINIVGYSYKGTATDNSDSEAVE